MANPTAPASPLIQDFKGLHIKCAGIMDNNGDVIATTQQSHIADLAAISGGESPTEAEHNLVVTKVNAILAALENAGILADA